MFDVLRNNVDDDGGVWLKISRFEIYAYVHKVCLHSNIYTSIGREFFDTYALYFLSGLFRREYLILFSNSTRSYFEFIEARTFTNK